MTNTEFIEEIRGAKGLGLIKGEIEVALNGWFEAMKSAAKKDKRLALGWLSPPPPGDQRFMGIRSDREVIGFLRRLSGGVIALALVACSSGSPSQVPDPTHCGDGVLSPGETDVDCGGICPVRCAPGSACAVADDCVFGVCTDETCDLPAVGPEPTGTVAQTVDRDGATVTYVSPERVTVEVEIPPDALRGPVDLTLMSAPLAAGQWLSAEVRPAGLVFERPATIRVTLPPGVTTNDGWLEYRGGAYIIPLAPMVDEGGRTMTVTARFLGHVGMAPRFDAKYALMFDSYLDKMFLSASQLSADQSIPALMMLARQLVQGGQVEDAAALDLVIKSLILVISGDPARQQEFDQLMAELRREACSTYASKKMDLENSVPKCQWELRFYAAPVMASAAMVQMLNADGTCPEALQAGYLVNMKAEELVKFMKDQTNRDQLVRCICNAPESPPPNPPLPPYCSLYHGPVSPPRQPLLSLDQRQDWQILVDEVTRASRLFYDLYAIDMGALADTLGAMGARGVAETVWKSGYELCQTTEDMGVLGALAAVLADPTPVQVDAHHCASTLAISIYDSKGTLREQHVASPGAAPGTSPTTLAISAVAGDVLKLRGPLAALVCYEPDLTSAERIENDVLTLYLVRQGSRHAWSHLTPSGTRLMTDSVGFDVDVGAVRTALGLAANEPFDLVLERSGPACGGRYGTPVDLFTVTVGASCQPVAGSEYCVQDLGAMGLLGTDLDNAGRVVGCANTACADVVLLWDGSLHQISLPKNVGGPKLTQDGGFATMLMSGELDFATAVVWKDGNIRNILTSLPAIPGFANLTWEGSYVTDINDAGDAIGRYYISTSNGEPGPCYAGSQMSHCQGYEPHGGGPNEQIGLQSSVRINNARQVLGVTSAGEYAIWQPGGTVEMIAGPTWNPGPSILADLNDQGMVVAVHDPSGTAPSIMLQTPTGFITLPPLPGFAMVAVGGLVMNNDGVVVASYADVAGWTPAHDRCVVWRDGVPQDLTPVWNPTGTPLGCIPIAINDRGQILISSLDPVSDTRGSFLLTPAF